MYSSGITTLPWVFDIFAPFADDEAVRAELYERLLEIEDLRMSCSTIVMKRE